MRANGLLSTITYLSRYSRPDLGCLSYEASFRRLMDILGIRRGYKSFLISCAKQNLVFPSMRGIQFLDGVLSRHERLFNCAGIIIDSWDKVHKVFYLLLCGCGVGFNISRKHVSRLSPVIGPDPSASSVVHVVEDSVLGWALALDALIRSYTVKGSGEVVFNYSKITPKGTILPSCGRPAPGPEPLQSVLENVRKKLQSMIGKDVRPIDVHDIICMASQGVVAGGVRRSALISVFDYGDEEMLNAKIGNWWNEHPYRSLANNSFIMTPDLFNSLGKDGCIEMYRSMLQRCLEYGEPGVVHLPSSDHVVNPCCEIVFHPWVDGVSSYQLCNLTEVSVRNAVTSTKEGITDAVRAASIIGTHQASFTKMYDEVAEALVKRDALLGVSLTGLYDYVYDYDWSELAKIAVEVNEEVSRKLGINKAARVTCIKPSGTVSCLAGHNSGIHPWFDSGLRNVTLSDNEIAYVVYRNLLQDAGISDVDSLVVPHPLVPNLYICPFPYTAQGTTWSKVSAIDMLSRILYMTGTWIRNGYRKELSGFHNSVSCTVMFSESEIDDISQFLYYANRDSLDKYGQFACVGISFLARTNKYASRIAPFCPASVSPEVEEIYHRLAEAERNIQKDIRRLISRSVSGHQIGEMNGGCENESCYFRQN